MPGSLQDVINSMLAQNTGRMQLQQEQQQQHNKDVRL
jgi:hypothetical protein